MTHMPALQARWAALLTQLGVDVAAGRAVWRELRDRYEGPDRHYHNLAHISACLDTLATLPPRPDTPFIQLALWFHDVIYDTRAQDNEQQSAAFAASHMAAWSLPPPARNTVRDLILATAHQAAANQARRGAAAQMVDCDLAILGAAPAAYDRYTTAIRREYSWVPAPVYTSGRLQVIDHFLAQPHIFHSDEGRHRWEAPARANLTREKERLSGNGQNGPAPGTI